MSQPVLYALTTVGALLTLGLGIGWARASRRHRTSVANLETSRVNERQLAAAAQQSVLWHATQQHRMDLHRAGEQHRHELDRAQQLTLQWQTWTAKRLDWELQSRAMLADMLSQRRLSAVMATNVMFVVSSIGHPPFVAQVDHLILTDKVALVVENKGWAGLIFDGVPPGRAEPVLERLFGEPDLPASYAVRLKAGDHFTVETLAKVGRESPRSQVRAQARRLHAELAAISGLPYLNTCVLYSNPRAHVHFEPWPSHPGDATLVAASAQDVGRVLSLLAEGSTRRVPVQAIADRVAAMGADLWGFGEFATRYAPVILPSADPAADRQR